MFLIIAFKSSLNKNYSINDSVSVIWVCSISLSLKTLIVMRGPHWEWSEILHGMNLKPNTIHIVSQESYYELNFKRKLIFIFEMSSLCKSFYYWKPWCCSVEPWCIQNMKWCEHLLPHNLGVNLQLLSHYGLIYIVIN